jgi:von Willebrand factor type A domain
MLTLASGLGFSTWDAAAQRDEENGVALAVVYDTSGSMRETVKDSEGKSSPKFEIANRALNALVDRLEKFRVAQPGKTLRCGLVVFQGNDARAAIPFGNFDAAAWQKWVQSFHTPEGSTPLGISVRFAAQSVSGSKLKRKHILVITDGINTTGHDPAQVIAQLRREKAGDGGLGIHFIAFDIAANVFEPLKKLDVTVVSAANEPQLDAQLSYILEEKVLLEDEEAPAAKKP